MKELDALRQEIDQIDRQMVELFVQRMAATQQVGEYKQAHHIPVLDNSRQQQVLAGKTALVEDPARKADVAQLYEAIMGISRRQQRKIVQEGTEEPNFARIQAALAQRRLPVERPKVVYQGEPGAYSEQACINFFGPQVETQGLGAFEDVFLALQHGQADYGVVPIENNSTGAIRQIYDLLGKYAFSLVGETTVKVEHCLVAPPGATLDTITHVYSHEQGIFQSEPFLKEHPGWTAVPYLDTAGSGKYVAETGDITKAAICSQRAAQLYGLKILAHRVNYSATNTTRFVVVSPRMELREGADKISTVLTTPHESGCLHEILGIFAVNGLNMVRLESRPIPGKSWEYMFFIEFTGSLTAPGMDGVLRELSQTAADFRVLGNFKSNLETPL